MRLWRWTALMALFGVLVHAGLVVRHNAMVLNAKLEHSALVAGLGVICSIHATGTQVPASELPFIPEPQQDPSSCPLCMGMAPPAAILAPSLLPSHAPNTIAMRMAVVGETIRLRLAEVRPPTRGPPAIV